MLIKDFLQFRRFMKSYDGSTLPEDGSFNSLANLFRLGEPSNRYNGYIFGCCDIWGKYISKTTFRLYDQKPYKGLVEETKHPFLTALNSMNKYQTFWQVKYSAGFNLGIYGSMYLLKLRDKLNVPREFVLLDSSRVNPVLTPEGEVRYQYSMDRAGVVEVPASEIIHLRYPNPDSMYKGKAIISYFLDQIDVNSLQTSYQKKFYKEGGFLGLTFTTNQQMTKEAWRRATEQLQNKYGGGISNAFSVALFEQGLEPVKAAYSMKEMDIKNSKELTRNEILSAFQCPAVLFGQVDGSDRKSFDAAVYAFTTGTIDPILDYFDAILTKSVQADFGQNWIVKHDSVAPKDIEGQLAYYESALDRGWLTLNEVRQEQGYDKYEHELADVPIINVGGTIVRLDKPTNEVIGYDQNSGGGMTTTPNNETPPVKE